MDPQETITAIHDRLERAIGGVCKMEDNTPESIEKAHDIIEDINSSILMLDGLRFAIRRGYHRVSVWPEPNDQELKNNRHYYCPNCKCHWYAGRFWTRAEWDAYVNEIEKEWRRLWVGCCAHIRDNEEVE